MRILFCNIPIPALVLPPQDRMRLKQVSLNSIVWVASAIALHILLPVPGKALCAAAGTIVLSGLLFIRYSSGDSSQGIPLEYPKIPHISLLFAIMVQPYSAPLGLALSAAAGCLYGFYYTRLPIVPIHEMAGL